MSQVVFVPVYIDKWKALTEALTEADRNRLIGAYLDYAVYGKEPKGLSKTCGVLFQFMRPTADDLWKDKGGAPLNNHNAKKKTTEKQPVETTSKQPVNSTDEQLVKTTENNLLYTKAKANTKANTERESHRENGAPTLEDVRKFIKDNKLKVNATRFFKYYQARGWRLDGEPIYDWQALVETWAEPPTDEPEKEPPKQRTPFTKCPVCGSTDVDQRGDMAMCLNKECGKSFDWCGGEWRQEK